MTKRAGETFAASGVTSAAIAEARLAALQVRFGNRLTTEQWGEVRERITYLVNQNQALRKIPLGNADEPEIVFTPFRGDKR